jgi:hypothetical protein
MKEVKVQLGDFKKEGLVWGYLWDALPEEDERDDSQRVRWFFPDSYQCSSLLWMLTIARWWRSWDRRWYIAGLALTPADEGFVITNEGRESITVPFMERVGYFEHSWVTEHKHWHDEEDMTIVAIT